MASSTKLGVWHLTGVRVQRTGRRTYHVYPVKSLVLNMCRAARGGISGGSRENLRRATQRAMSAETRMPSSAGRGRRRKAPSSRPAPPRRCLPPFPYPPPPSDARSAAAAPRAPPYDRGKAAAATQERRLAPDGTLRRQLSRAPHPSPTPPCARVPPSRHAQPSAEPADGSQLPSPPPPARGAAAPPSLCHAVCTSADPTGNPYCLARSRSQSLRSSQDPH